MEPAVDINLVLGAALAYGFAMFVRWLGRTRFWSRIAEGTKRIMRDPTIPITDAREAAERALVEAQSKKLDEVARAVSQPPPPTLPRVTTLRGITSPEDGNDGTT